MTTIFGKGNPQVSPVSTLGGGTIAGGRTGSPDVPAPAPVVSLPPPPALPVPASVEASKTVETNKPPPVDLVAAAQPATKTTVDTTPVVPSLGGSPSVMTAAKLAAQSIAARAGRKSTVLTTKANRPVPSSIAAAAANASSNSNYSKSTLG